MSGLLSGTAVEANLQDLAEIESLYRRLHYRTRDEHWAEEASKVRQYRDAQAQALSRPAWVDRVGESRWALRGR